MRGAKADTMEKLYELMEPGGATDAPLDLRVVFPDVGVRADAVWSMLYLAGYVTTDDVEIPNDTERLRRLRIPNREVSLLFRAEIVQRFAEVVGGRGGLARLHAALRKTDAEGVREALELALLNSASFFDLKSENSYHMLALGLLFGVPGYGNPVSNREAGRGRFDVQLTPENPDRDPLITLELKCAEREGDLEFLALEALSQIGQRAYDAACGSAGSIRYGIAFSGKRVAVQVEQGGATLLN